MQGISQPTLRMLHLANEPIKESRSALITMAKLKPFIMLHALANSRQPSTGGMLSSMQAWTLSLCDGDCMLHTRCWYTSHIRQGCMSCSKLTHYKSAHLNIFDFHTRCLQFALSALTTARAAGSDGQNTTEVHNVYSETTAPLVIPGGVAHQTLPQHF